MFIDFRKLKQDSDILKGWKNAHFVLTNINEIITANYSDFLKHEVKIRILYKL